MDLNELRRNEEAAEQKQAFSTAAAVLTDHQRLLICRSLWSMPPDISYDIWSGFIPPEAERPALVLQAALGSADLGSPEGNALLIAGIDEFMDSRGRNAQESAAYLKKYGMSDEQIRGALEQISRGGQTPTVASLLSEYVLPFLIAGVVSKGLGTAGGLAAKVGRAALKGRK